ncbi:MAG: carbohydrate binding family 9 domain-containing protein, partial [Acidobacteria bacterium]|nr:carbohydrate binding family 9 domain-containing protein [Acidobacteriota bacterium]
MAIATYTAQKITIDGVLDEPAWKAAPPVGDFIQREPIEGVPPTEAIETTILYDKDNLYIGAYCHDRNPERIIVSDITRDFGTNQDYFGVLVDTFGDGTTGYYFSTTPAGGQRDSQVLNNGLVNNYSWDGVWYVKGRLREDGYVIE